MEWNKENTAAVGRIPSGLFIVTAGTDRELDGYLASWIQQVSFAPLMVSVAIKPGRPCHDAIIKSGHFAINIIGKKGASVLKHFWKGYDPHSNPFANLEYEWASHGGVLLKQAMCALECQVKEVLTPGDHQIILADVLRCHMLDASDENMVHVRKSGLDY